MGLVDFLRYAGLNIEAKKTELKRLLDLKQKLTEVTNKEIEAQANYEKSKNQVDINDATLQKAIIDKKEIEKMITSEKNIDRKIEYLNNNILLAKKGGAKTKYSKKINTQRNTKKKHAKKHAKK